jgi:hypothetical protein
VHGAPVVETRLHVPGGDVVHRTWAVAHGGGLTLVDVANESPLAIAVAFTRSDLRTARPPAAVPIAGLDAPVRPAIVLPVGHRASATVALAHQRSAPGRLGDGWPPADAVARGWRRLSDEASRLELPDEALVERVVTERSALALAGPPRATDDPVGFLLAVAELERMGLGSGILDDVAAAVAAIGRRPGWDVDTALEATATVLVRRGERRAVRDLEAVVARRTPAPMPTELPTGVGAVAAIEQRLARAGVLFPAGIPVSWRGRDLTVHGLPIGPSSTVSFAVRWHGHHAAVLWEVSGEPVELTAPAVDPAWRTRSASGDALWRRPVPAAERRETRLGERPP